MTNKCKAKEIDFIVKMDDPQMKVVEDDIRENLEAIGIKVNTRFLDDEAYAKAELEGDYHLLFTRTWGAPYDPHSYMSSWEVPAHVEYSAIGNLEPPLTREDLLSKIKAVQKESDIQRIRGQWREILKDVHAQALFLPLWGTRVPYVLNRRLANFQPAPQVWSLPVSTISVLDGSQNVTVSPGVGSLFTKTGPINPHQYSPNALWAQDWIYEGLVSYGQDGLPAPALATKWRKERILGSGERYIFQLRKEVEFHDGTPWNCQAAVLNFDHVLSDTVRKRHQWMGVGKHLKAWSCGSDVYELILETDTTFYPFLQELSYIRPLRFASPMAFAEDFNSDADLHNSCEAGGFGSKYDYLEDTVTCMGLKMPWGTGPLKYVGREEAADGSDAKVVFARNDKHWAGASSKETGIEFLTAVQYDSTEDVEAALRSGELDMALGIGPLEAKQVQDLKYDPESKFNVLHSDVIQNSLLVFNANKAPTDDIDVRRAFIHAVNKAAFLEDEFYGLEEPVDQLLPRTAPYCDVELSPKWGYDFQKAQLLNCPSDSTSSLSSGAIAGISIAAVVGVFLTGFIVRMIIRERQGKPVFAPVNEKAIELS